MESRSQTWSKRDPRIELLENNWKRAVWEVLHGGLGSEDQLPLLAQLCFSWRNISTSSNAITIRRDWFDGTSMRWESGALVFRASLCSLRSVGDDLVVNCDQSKLSSAVRHDEFWFLTPISDEWWIWWIWRGRSDERIHHSSVMNKIHRNLVTCYKQL